MTQQQALAAKINDLRDELIRTGVNIPFALKRRDPIEPGRTEKENLEDKIFALFMKQFRKQKKFIKELLERFSFQRMKTTADEVKFFMDSLGDDFYEDPEMVAQLSKLLTEATKNGVELFAESNILPMDYTLTNTQAAAWANKYTFELIKGINKTTTKSLRTIFKSYIDTPGMTIGNLVDLLPFDASRALMIGTTEITRSYATAAQMAGEDLAEEFPGVRVIKQWWTNNDAIVQNCPICWPLHAVVVDIDKLFAGQFSSPPAHVRCRCWMNTTTRIVEQPDIAAPPVKPVPVPTGGSFGNSIRYRESKRSWEFDEAVKKMDSVIGMGEGEYKARLSWKQDMKELGRYSARTGNIQIRWVQSGNEFTTLHEIGHSIDRELLIENLGGEEGWKWASRQASSAEFDITGIKEIDDFWEVVYNSKGIKGLEKSQEKFDDDVQFDYLLDRREIFARSYAQYIAEKTQDEALLWELDNEREDTFYDSQWTSDDFQPILRALDKLFEAAGMLK